MDKLITVLTAPYPQDLWIIKTRLESEGITCFLKDELTVQSYALYSNAIGGVKLQVWEEDVERATAVLTESGYFKNKHRETDLLSRAIAITAAVPLINRLPGLWRVTVIAVFIATLLIVGIWLAVMPNKYEYLTSTTWAVTEMYFENKRIEPKSNEVPMVLRLDTSITPIGELWFQHFGGIQLPGINSNPVVGRWKLNDEGTVTIYVDTFKNIYSGTYQLDMDLNSIILKSPTTTIYAKKYY